MPFFLYRDASAVRHGDKGASYHPHLHRVPGNPLARAVSSVLVSSFAIVAVFGIGIGIGIGIFNHNEENNQNKTMTG